MSGAIEKFDEAWPPAEVVNATVLAGRTEGRPTRRPCCESREACEAMGCDQLAEMLAAMLAGDDSQLSA